MAIGSRIDDRLAKMGEWVRVQECSVGIRAASIFIPMAAWLHVFDRPQLVDAAGDPDMQAVAHFEKQLEDCGAPAGIRVVRVSHAIDRMAVHACVVHESFTPIPGLGTIPEFELPKLTGALW